MWNFEVRKHRELDRKSAARRRRRPADLQCRRGRNSIWRPADREDQTPEQGREMVRKLATQKPDYIKIWYIVPTASPCSITGTHRLPRPE